MRLRSHRAARRVLLATVYLAMPLLASAEDQTAVNAQRQFGPIDRAVLKVVPPPEEWRFNRGLLESDLQDFACDYELHTEESTAALRSLLNRAVFADDRAATSEFGVLIGIYLTAMDGTLTKVFIGQSVEDGSARGTINGQRVVASKPFERDLRRMVATMTPTTIRYTCESEKLSSGAVGPSAKHTAGRDKAY